MGVAAPQGIGPLVLGGTGDMGRALRRCWPSGAPQGLWQQRPGRPAPHPPGLEWDILNAPPPARLPAGLSGLLVLAGVTSGDATALARNTDLALAGVDLAQRAGLGRVLVASSQAVYGAVPGAAAEHTPCRPVNPYGAAKLAMEQALQGRPGVTILRIGNLAGSGALFRQAALGPVMLDRFADGQSPRRSYIGPAELARVILALLAHPDPLPPVLNVALPGAVAMSALLEAAGVGYAWQPAPPAALPEALLDVSLLRRHLDLPAADPARLVAEARQGGWQSGWLGG